ncbi:MAG: hypothetical protein ACE5I3_00950 [Phycisphaerae bacterium]
MMPAQVLRGARGGLLLAVLALVPAVRAQSAESKFHRAYFLEHARGELAAAAQAYDEVAADRDADAKLRAEARARRQVCREELASADFAQLMPPDALVYAELNRPGGQLSRLLKMLGLLREDGSLAADPERRLAISPALIRELLGIRGAAVAVTGFDPASQTPSGVAILHPGDIEVIRGLIETALPAGAQFAEPIEGFPTYLVEGRVFVTLTRRLILASQQRGEIENVVFRLKGEESESLANKADLAELLQQRDDGLLFFCVNFKPVMPLLNALMAAGGTQSCELAVAQALLDLKSLRALVGRMGVSDEGLYLDVALQLDEGHRNLVFQFLRMPAINRETLKRVPSGVAGFFATALNEAGEHDRPTPLPSAETPPVTILDIGREIFANIVSIAVFAVPTGEEAAGDGPPIPPVAAVITVKDPVKSLALWSQALGVGSLASGAGALDGMRVKIEGVEAQRYIFPDGISIYLANAGHDVLISPSKAAIARALATLRGGESILNDPAFSKSLARVGSNTTFALFAHPGRCAELAKPFMSAGEVKEMQPVVELLTDTVASVVMEHSNEMFHFSAMVTGLPDVGPFVSRMITAELSRAEQANLGEMVWKEFRSLGSHKGDHEAALALAEKLFETLHDDALRLNKYAWKMLTKDEFEGRFNEVALKFSKRSNELTDQKNWMFVDTLALALFETGDAKAAVELEKKALALCGDDSRRGEVEAALQRFEAALER